ncbi:MAG: HAMP domain-containing protein, partial [Chloroflexi bacterium]|nr:HAMP domain-containing protein [Chloroflexota bacterium]
AAAAPLLIIEALVGGAAAELLRTGRPAAWPRRVAARPAPYARSLNRRILFGLIPLGLFGIGVLYWADTRIAINVATTLVVDQMGRSAENAARGIPFFISTGRSLLKNLAGSPDLLDADPAQLPQRLQRDLRSVPFFSQLVLFNEAQQPLAGYPEEDFARLTLSEAETQAILFAFQGVPQDVTLYPGTQGGPVLLSFVAPVLDASGELSGVLLGRADLSENPLMQPVIEGLQNVVAGQGVGFLADEAGRVIYHPDPLFLGTAFEPDPGPRRLPTRVEGGEPYRDLAPDGTRRLVYYLPVSTHPWSVVIQMPYTVVLALATQISTPLVVILLIIGVAALAVISYLAQRLTSPLESLAVAVAQMTEGDLLRPMQVSGEDEVGRLGLAFDAMRQRLRARLDELNLLLTVSQGVAGSLSLDESLPPILQGALAASGAAGVRLALPARDEAGAPASGAAPQTFALGAAAPAMAPLDGAILTLTREDGKAVIENLARARAVLDPAPVAGKIQALIAAPLKQEENFLGALWLGYDAPHVFSEAEENCFATLAGQAAVAVVNARLFETAERGRERLAAILASTPDPVIVTDRSERLLLVNPAAQFAFGLDPQTSVNKPVAQVIKNAALLKALRTPGADPAANEVQLEGGVTLYASTSPINAAGDKPAGRVTVLRDVTRFKELEHLKSEFVDTVSHDLRSPLTYIRGYATMLPMVGALNDKQKEFVDK